MDLFAINRGYRHFAATLVGAEMWLPRAVKYGAKARTRLWGNACVSKSRSSLWRPASLGMHEGSSTQTVTHALGAKVLRVAGFAVDFAIIVIQCCRLQTLPTLLATEAAAMPRLASPHHLLRRVNRLTATWTFIGSTKGACQWGWIGVECRLRCTRLLGADAQALPAIGAQDSRSLSVAVALGAQLLAVARTAEDFIPVRSQRRAVQALSAHGATEAEAMVALSIADHLLRLVDCLGTPPTPSRHTTKCRHA